MAFVFGVDRDDPFSYDIADIKDLLLATDAETGVADLRQGSALGILFHHNRIASLVSELTIGILHLGILMHLDSLLLGVDFLEGLGTLIHGL